MGWDLQLLLVGVGKKEKVVCEGKAGTARGRSFRKWIRCIHLTLRNTRQDHVNKQLYSGFHSGKVPS